jgi:hypothetical protein
MYDALTRLGLVDDEEIVLDEAALSLALLDHPKADLARYQDILTAIATRLDAFAREAEHPAERADALAKVLAGELGLRVTTGPMMTRLMQT